MVATFKTIASLSLLAAGAHAFNAAANDNMVVYWGQNSYGGAGGAESGWQKNISAYCTDDSIDIIPMSSIDVFYDTGNLPNLNLANICNDVDDPVFAGSDLPNCQWMAADIEACQSAGKLVLLSLGGAGGGGQFTSASEASAFGTLLWDLFLGGSGDTRPFGSAVLDGIDIDIEGGGTTYFSDMIEAIQTAASGYSKKMYISGAPQCPYPDAYMGTVLNSASFDFVWPQFYNNYCAVSNYGNSADWDFSDWAEWAATVSVNPNVKVYIGALASSTAGQSGYAPQSTVIEAALAMQQQYSSFGGVMLWDASQAVANGNFQVGIKNALVSGSGGGAPTTSTKRTSSSTKTTSTTSTTKTTSTKTTSTTSTSSSSSGGGTGCSGAAAWTAADAYPEGSQVTYDGDLWTASQWNEDEVPGGSSGAWVNTGACDALAAAQTKLAAVSKASVASAASASAAVTKAVSASPAVSKTAAAAPAATHASAEAKPTLGSRFFRD